MDGWMAEGWEEVAGFWGRVSHIFLVCILGLGLEIDQVGEGYLQLGLSNCFRTANARRVCWDRSSVLRLDALQLLLR